MRKGDTKPGVDLFLDSPDPLNGKRKIGLICNSTSVTSASKFFPDELLASKHYSLVALFSPEHGLFSVAQDMEGVGKEEYKGVPVYSLYGKSKDSLAPSKDALSNIDCLLFDIQDIGARYYTYIWTMTLAMEVCAKVGIPFVVCDRPNPIGGQKVQGPLLEKEFSSFVGLHPVCTRHGMTCGEIALMVNRENNPGCDLTVLECENWERDFFFEDTNLPWIMPSPNMPTVDTALVYPGGCLVEGTNLSEGRGTTRPFEIIGAPFLSKDKLAGILNNLDLPGVFFRPVMFKPTFSKFAGKICQGVFVHVTNRNEFLPVESYLALILAARDMGGEKFQWRKEVYEFVLDKPAIDLLFGSEKTRKQIEAGVPFCEIVNSWKQGIKDFEKVRKPYLLY